MQISTSIWNVQHPNAGQNIQQTGILASKPIVVQNKEEGKRYNNNNNV